MFLRVVFVLIALSFYGAQLQGTIFELVTKIQETIENNKKKKRDGTSGNNRDMKHKEKEKKWSSDEPRSFSTGRS